MVGISAGKQLILEGSKGSSNSLFIVKTSSKIKPETIKKIKLDLENWLENKNFDEFRNKKIDLSLVIYTSELNMKIQDVDNIAKIILDAICFSKHHGKPFLFENDNQILRLLVYKIKQEEMKESNTDEFVISFREHNAELQMNLIERGEI